MLTHFDYMKSYAGSLMEQGVLDVGCGRGDFLLSAAREGCRVAGIDVNSDKIANAVKRFSEEGLRADISLGFAEALPYESSSFGFVNCSEVTEHVQDPIKTLAEIERVLVAGGKAYISFHNRFGFYDYHVRAPFINWMPRAWADALCNITQSRKNDGMSGYQLPGEMHYFTYRAIHKILKDLGFLIQDTREVRLEKIKNSIVRFLAVSTYKCYRATFIGTFHVVVTKK